MYTFVFIRFIGYGVYFLFMRKVINSNSFVPTLYCVHRNWNLPSFNICTSNKNKS